MPQATIPDVLPVGPQTGVRRAWWVMTVFAVLIGLYALAQQDGRPSGGRFFGQHWIDHLHFTCGGLALIVGPFSFRRDILEHRPRIHRAIGTLYMLCVLLSGITAVLMASNSMTGIVSHLGFGLLGVLWLVASAVAMVQIKRGDVLGHRRWMVRSYALCFAAATLRLQIPLLTLGFGDFSTAYRVVSWSCWVPNLVFAELWLRRTSADGSWIAAGRTYE